MVLGVTGSIAAFRAADMASQLTKTGRAVQVVMTAEARHFITPLTLQVLSKHPVVTDLFDEKEGWQPGHIELADRADLLLIAPATAQIIAELAWGFANHALSAIALATRAPILARARDERQDVAAPGDAGKRRAAARARRALHRPGGGTARVRVRRRRAVVAGGRDHRRGGKIARGVVGQAASPAGTRAIHSDVCIRLPHLPIDAPSRGRRGRLPYNLRPVKILITAGPTREPLDPVRYLSNRSSGKMGYAIARAALDAGHETVLVSGPVALAAPAGARVVPVTTSDEMFEAVHSWVAWADVCVLCAAVADFRPARVETQKIKKENRARLTLELVPTRDILRSLRDYAPPRVSANRVIVGFAAETNALAENARRKLREKGCALVIANDVSQHEIGFESDENELFLFFASGEERTLARAKKEVLAHDLVKIFAEIRK